MPLLRCVLFLLLSISRVWATDCSSLLAAGDHYQYDAVVFGSPAVVYWTTYSGMHPAGCNTRIVLDINTNTSAYTCDACTACPSNMQLSNGTCVPIPCPTGQTRNPYTNQCQDTCPTGAYPTSTWVGLNSAVSGLPDMCLGGCVITSSTCGSGGGKTECQLGNVTGSFCDPSKTYANQASGATTATNPSQLSPEAQCLAKGQSYGYVNGQVVCVSPMDGGATPTTQTKGSSQPGQQYTQTTIDPTTQTVNTTNYTSNTGGGGTISGTPTTQTQADFCAQNPNLTICKTSAAGGTGDCTKQPSCSGDAVQCAILLQSWANGCAGQGSDEQKLYSTAASGSDANAASQLQAKAGTLNVDFSQQIDTSDSLGASGCPEDYQWNVLGHTIAVPFSQLCPILDEMQYIVVAFSLIFAASIIYRGMT